jgi:flagellar hook-associated protein 3 FlgL
MRVTTNTFPDTLVNQLSGLSVRQTRLQNQAATGQRIQNASDDPVAMRRVLDLQAESQGVQQYQRNIGRLQELATSVFSTVKSLQTISNRAGEIATLADGLKSPEEFAIYATELDELIKQAVQTANATNRGDYLLAGTRNDQPPFVATTNAQGQVTGVAYQGNETTAAMEVATGQTMTIQPPGANASGSGTRGLLADTASGADFFAHLISLRDHLQAGDAAGVATDRAGLERDEDNFIYHYGLNGAIQSRLEVSAKRMSDESLSLEGKVSQEVDADLAETLVRLNETQSAYQAALQSGATILKVSLMDYLR